MTDPSKHLPLTRDSVQKAHTLVQPYIHKTPVLTNTTLTNLASTPQSASSLRGTPWEGQTPAEPKIRLWFKCENLQKVGAFKVRGAFHALLRLKEAENGWEGEDGERRRRMGVVTHSSGNHAQALALAARTLGIPAHIVMPSISTPSKIAATKGYGANVIFSGSTSTEREEVVAKVQAETGAVLIPPYDHPDIMLGQGTMGLEFQEQVAQMIENGGMEGSTQVKCSFASPASTDGQQSLQKKGLDAIPAPCGGGGMLSGIALSAQGTGIKIYGAEPSHEGADDCVRGLAAGERITTVKTLTIADGLRTPVGVWPWKVISDKSFVEGVYSVTEEQILAAMKLVFTRLKLVVEPSAVVGLAVVLFHEGFRREMESAYGEEGCDIGVVFSGGNVGLEALGKLFEAKEVVEEREAGKLGGDGKRVAENVAG